MTESAQALDATQAAAAAQFERQSDRYGKSHILADTKDVALGLVGVEPSADARAWTSLPGAATPRFGSPATVGQ
jgi:hypothetical protein